MKLFNGEDSIQFSTTRNTNLNTRDFIVGELMALLFQIKCQKTHFYLAKVEGFLKAEIVGLGGLGVPCSPRDPRIAGSNPAEVAGFFQDVKILSTSPPGGTLSWGSRV